MTAEEFINYAIRCRNELYQLWKVEPENVTLYLDDCPVNCFVHPDDKNAMSVRSLRHTHREI
jgi:hypothetical protein